VVELLFDVGNVLRNISTSHIRTLVSEHTLSNWKNSFQVTPGGDPKPAHSLPVLLSWRWPLSWWLSLSKSVFCLCDTQLVCSLYMYATTHCRQEVFENRDKAGIREIYGEKSVRVRASIWTRGSYFRILLAWDKYSLSWGRDEYQEVTNRGIWQQKIEFVKVG